MKSEIEQKLQAILNNREEQKRIVEGQWAERQRWQSNNVSDFDRKKQDVIRPALQEIVDLYKAKGSAIYILETEEETDPRRGTIPASIRLDMTGVYGRSDMHPEFKLSFDKQTRSLSLYTATHSEAGPRGNISLGRDNWRLDSGAVPKVRVWITTLMRIRGWWPR